MATIADELARKLEETHSEIAHVRSEVIEALRAFYSSAAGISVDEAIKVADKWVASRKHSYNPHPLADGATTAAAPPRSDLQDKIERLSGALLSTVEQLQLGSGGAAAATTAPHAQLVYSFTQRERLKRQMAQSKDMLALIEQLTAIDRLLSDIDSLLADAHLERAARAVLEAQQLLAALTGGAASTTDAPSNSSSSHETIVRIIERQVLAKQNALTQQLKRLYATSLVWTDGALRVANSADTTPLREFWAACAVTGALSERLADVAKAFAKHVLAPALQSAQATTRTTHDGNFAVLEVVRSSTASASADAATSADNVAPVAAQCSSVVAVLAFVHTEVLQSDAALMAQLSMLLWTIPGNLEAQLVRLLQDQIPQDAAALGPYREALATGVRELEDQLLAIGFTACANSQLRSLVQRVHELHAKKRRQAILSHGRDLMSRGYSDSVKIDGATERCNVDASVGASATTKSKSKSKSASGGAAAARADAANSDDSSSSGAFQVPDYRVSACAYDVVALVHETLLEACTAAPACARLLFQTSRDLLLLLRAVVPTLYERAIAHDARASMLFHNDCLYVAHHALTVGHVYKHRLPAPLSRTATMVDMVPALRDAGERALVAFARNQSDELAAGVAQLPTFSDVDSEPALNRVEDFVKSALYRLQRISADWREGLPPPVYRTVTGLLVAPLTTGFVDRIFAASKLSAAAGAQLHHLALLLLECESLFDSPGQADKHVPSLAKLRKLASLLTEPVATVRDQFVAGNLAPLAPQELVQVVRSLHRDSPERRELLSVLL